MKKKILTLDSKLKVVKMELRSPNSNYWIKMSLLEKELFEKLKDSSYGTVEELEREVEAGNETYLIKIIEEQPSSKEL